MISKLIGVVTSPSKKKIFSQKMSMVREKRSQWKAVEQEDGVSSLQNVSTMVFLEVETNSLS